MNDAQVKEILLRENYVSAEDIKKAEESALQKKIPIVEYLITEKILNKNLLGQAFAESYGIPYSDLSSHAPSKEQILLIPEETAKKLRVAVFFNDETQIKIATDNPVAEGLLAQLQTLFPEKTITLSFALDEDIEETFIHYRKSLQARFIDIIKTQARIAPEILNEIIKDTATYHASDIHCEPQENKEVIIRFRIDGVLHEVGRISKDHYDNLLNRVKVQANLRIDEHNSCQDGAIRIITGENHHLDLRVSIVPALYGEKLVMRILSEYIHGLQLIDLGLSQEDQKTLLVSAKKPFGMILVTGPTGSGKSTTLYSLIKILNKPEVNITTIEDPVEYKVSGINQIQVNPDTHLTFADGLRSIARQDPDIILVGEIRDKETAEIAVNAALTGHLLLTTFHANDGATAIPRLLDIGVEPFLIASSLEVVIAQRLVRKTCEGCRYSYPSEHKDFSAFTANVEKYFENCTLYAGKGCNACGQTGFKGRIAIYEFIKNTPEMQDLILHAPPIKAIWELARTQGSRSLFEDGVDKVKSGVTTVEELLRVASPPIYLNKI